MSDDPKETIVEALLASGFPFQTAISEIVSRVPNCKVVAEEFPWRDEAGNDRFLDLVVNCFNFVVSIECKKTKKETLTFLQPSTILQRMVNRTRCGFLTQIQDSTKRIDLFCGDWELTPESSEAAFCVVSTSSRGGDQRLLEKDAQLLIRAADAFGEFLMRSIRPQALGEPDRIVVPLLVTNAQLFQVAYDPTTVSLESGEIPRVPAPDITPIQWIRFRKPFTSNGRDVGERTVFVVAARFLDEFLRKLQQHTQPAPPSRRTFLATTLR